jgi:hypothetical protein
MKRPREIAVNLPDIPVEKTPLDVRLMTHADSMQSEGWYTTANVLAEAADQIKAMRVLLCDIGIDYEYKHPNSALLPRIRAALR